MRPRLKGALEGERRPGRAVKQARSQGPTVLAPPSSSSFSSCPVRRGEVSKKAACGQCGRAGGARRWAARRPESPRRAGVPRLRQCFRHTFALKRVERLLIIK